MGRIRTFLFDKAWGHAKRAMSDLSRVLFPLCCPVCHQPLVDGEELLCLECHWKIPRTNYHLSSDNPLHHKLIDIHTPIEKAASFFFYKNESPYSRLIRDAKYNGHPEIDRDLARLFALELRPTGFFDDIDIIMPVPIHWSKRIKRGYNQTEHIARGLSDISGIPVACNLRAVKGHSTQTRKKAKERRNALLNIFKVDHPDELAGLHILLVDDVITTGATMMTCAATLHHSIPGLRLSVLSLATTKLGQ